MSPSFSSFSAPSCSSAISSNSAKVTIEYGLEKNNNEKSIFFTKLCTLVLLNLLTYATT